jgi:hypothetical protein
MQMRSSAKWWKHLISYATCFTTFTPKETEHCLLLNKDKNSKKFQQGFREIWLFVIDILPVDAVANKDSGLMAELLKWITSTSALHSLPAHASQCSQSLIPFRLTATVAAMRLVAAIIPKVQEARRSADSTEKALQASKGAKGKKAAADGLAETKESLLELVESLDSVIMDLFNT